VTLRDISEHAVRRRVWDRAFTPSAVKSYDPLLRNRIDQLMSQLSTRLGRPIDIAEWLGFLSIDFMGDFAYGGAFDLLQDGQDRNGYHDIMGSFVSMLELLGAIPWIKPLALRLPKNSGVQKMLSLSSNIVEKRASRGSTIRDLFYYLVGNQLFLTIMKVDHVGQLDEDGQGGDAHPHLSPEVLSMEATIALIAGSDTTATALANAVAFIVEHPAVLSTLRAELDAAAGEGTPFDAPLDADLVALKYLQAVIDETLRLRPAVPNGSQRQSPAGVGPVVVAGQ
jgi:cytochrome P450